MNTESKINDTRKAELLTSTVEHIDITKFDARPIVEAMGKMSFTSRDLASATGIYNQMLSDPNCSVILVIAGSTSAGGCMDLYAELVRSNMVDGIVATGATPKRLNVPGEDEFYGRGVSTCATCDGFFYRGKTVVVVGGGDAAVEEAMFLTKFAERVTLIHRRGELRANKEAQRRAFANPKMSFVWHTVVEEVVGEGGQVTGAAVRNVDTGERETIEADGVFVYVGHNPNTAYLGELIELSSTGYARVRDDVYTNVPGVFAAGDVADEVYRQLATSVGAGVRAAMAAERYLAEKEAHVQITTSEADVVNAVDAVPAA